MMSTTAMKTPDGCLPRAVFSQPARPKRIAFTFAGRRLYMQSLARLMQQAINRGVIDEWHIWDFSRNAADQNWLDNEFSHSTAYLTGPGLTDFKTLLANPVQEANIFFYVRHDAHILVTIEDGTLYEVVLGANGNTTSLIRMFSSKEQYHSHAAAQRVWSWGLPWDGEQCISIKISSGEIIFSCMGLPGFQHRAPSSSTYIQQIAVLSTQGSWGWWSLQEPSRHSTVLVKADASGYQGFRAAYNYYSDQRFANTHFVKMDDDIVFFDVNCLDGMLAYSTSRLLGNCILSANVINNGVCAYLQGRKGYLPDFKADLEYPKHGICGSLWESGEKCTLLHEYFVENYGDIRRRASLDEPVTQLPYYDRFSINFVTFGSLVMRSMSAAYLAYPKIRDDEELMTRALPKLFGIPKYIYNHFLVSHLSFFKQEPQIDARHLVALYDKLTDDLSADC